MNVREQILLKIVEKCNELSSIKKTRRIRPTQEEFKTVSDQQLPLLAIDSPAPAYKGLLKDARHPFDKVVKHKFSMPIEFTCYYKAIEDNADTLFGTIYDDLYCKMFEEPYINGLVSSVEAEPSVVSRPFVITPPYYAFLMIIKVEYSTVTGI